MKKFLVALLFLALIITPAFGAQFFWKDTKTALDGIAGLANGDRGLVIDSNGDVHFYTHNGVSWVVASPPTIGFTVLTPADSSDFFIGPMASTFTISELTCIVDPADTGETITVQVNECNSTGDSCVNGGISVTASNTGATDTTFTDAVIDADDYLQVLLGAPTGGTISVLACTIIK
ncbi:MAG: hypothetical protein ACWGQW_04770 [bacterium]